MLLVCILVASICGTFGYRPWHVRHHIKRGTAINLNNGLIDVVGSLPVAVDAWSVSNLDDSLNSSDLASSLFSASLLPYLALLYFLSRKETNTPALGNFGFQFLLVFVTATIPAGIIAKNEYHTILANKDFLHGSAESLLTITNLLIIFGFRNAFTSSTAPSSTIQVTDTLYKITDILLVIIFGCIGSIVLGGVTTIEPMNALSLPTWMVHTSSIFEWLIAMELIFNYANYTSNPRWKGMTIAMLLSQCSGLCACTFHLFYNSPSLNWLVNLQALTTVLGNSAMAFAAYRINQYANTQPVARSDGVIPPLTNAPEFVLSLTHKAFIGAFIVKYGELLLPTIFQYYNQHEGANGVVNGVVLGLVTLPVLATFWKYSQENPTANKRTLTE
jgi:hypothetical protein